MAYAFYANWHVVKSRCILIFYAPLRDSTPGQKRISFSVYGAERHNAPAGVRQAIATARSDMPVPVSLLEKTFVQFVKPCDGWHLWPKRLHSSWLGSGLGFSIVPCVREERARLKPSIRRRRRPTLEWYRTGLLGLSQGDNCTLAERSKSDRQ